MLFISCLLIGSNAVASPNKKAPIDNYRQQKGIPISQVDFDQLVKSFIVVFQKGDTLKNINDYVTIVRLFNTISTGNFYVSEEYKIFLNFYAPKYAMLAIKNLEAVPKRGLYFYSKKYDLNIGGPLTDNSVFIIIQKK